MVPERIKLVNYCQHRKLDVEFNGSLIALIGSNGTGKSNFLGALQFALTGEHPGKTKKDLVSWGCEDGSVELFFTYQGMKCRVLRTLKKGTAELEIGDAKYSGTSSVNQVLSEVLGIDKDQARQSVFVRQSEFDSILFNETPRNRNLLFAKLIGIGEAESIYKDLGTILASYGKTQDFTDEIERQRERISKMAETLDLKRKEISGYEKSLTSLPGVDELSEEIRKLTEDVAKYDIQIKDMHRGMELQRNLDSYDMSTEERCLDKIRAVYKGDTDPECLKEYQNKISSDVSAKRGILNTFRKYSLHKDTIKRLSEELKKLAEEKSLCPTTESVEAIESEIHSLKESIALADGQIRALRKFSVPRGTTKCPLCGNESDVDIHDDIEQRIKASDVPELRSRLSELERIDTAGMRLRIKTMNETIHRKLNEYDSERAMVSSILNDNPDVASVNPDEIESSIIEDTDLSADIAIYLSHVSKRLKVHSSYTSELEVIKSRYSVDDFVAALKDIEVSSRILEEKLDGLHNISGELHRIKNLIAQGNGVIEASELALKEAEMYLDSLEKSKEAGEETAAKLATLQNVRNWFHNGNGPMTLISSVLAKLTDDTNRFLGEFTAPFVVESSAEGVGFKVRFTDGRTTPDELPDADVLSGGQKVQLAAAFRMAVYCMFASKLGLLVMDEPTAYLDEQNIECFGSLMNKIGEIARNMNVTVIVATHEKELIPVFTGVIQLGGN